MQAIDVVNQALAEAGATRLIGDFYEGSPASILATQVYSQTRDDLLRAKDWPFARRTVVLNLLKGGYTPPTNLWDGTQPPPPWLYEYAYPDCLVLRALRPNPQGFQGGDPYEPVPIRFAVATDPTATESGPDKVILTDLGDALAVITAPVTNPDQWEPLFSSALVDELAKIFARAARVLADKPQPDLEKLEMVAAQQSAERADLRRG